MNRGLAISLVESELTIATRKFGPFKSVHEGLAVIREEYKELEAEVFKNEGTRSLVDMETGAKQLAAMAIRFMVDLL